MLLSYIKSQRWPLIYASAVLLLMIALCWIAEVERQLAAYFLLLLLSITLLALALGYIRFHRRHRLLQLAQKEILISFDNLPEPKNALDEDYIELMQLLRSNHAASMSAHDFRYSEMLDYFTLWVHQIKTPISALRLMLQTRPENYDEGFARELMRIEQYVEMVLCYLRLDSDYSDYVFENCRLDDIIKQSVRKYAVQFIGKRISLDYAGTDKELMTDEKWLSFVIEQLLSNAIKYSKGGKITIDVREDSLVITDTGIGIASEDLPRVFQKGYTGYNGRTDMKSTGIGLYLCGRVAKNLGYDISISSELGAGTAVTIEFNTERAALFNE